jgi:tripartite-type tricarboxylate transporter receptor subunit TctC
MRRHPRENLMPLFALRAMTALTMALTLLSRASAQDLPSGMITLVVANAPGGIVDVTARLYADALSRNLGRTVVVENRPGAGGAAAAMSVKTAPRDGRTLLVYPGAQLAAMPLMQKVAYDPLKDFEPIATLFDLLNFIVVPPDSPANTISELLDYWKRSPNGLRVGAAGFGSPAHFNSVILSLDNALPITMVQYRGSAPLMSDLVTSRIDMAMVSYIASQPFAHKFKILAQDGATRWSGMPDVPTMLESGQLRKKASGWFAVAAPAGIPKAIVDRLNREFIKASREPQLAARLQQSGVLTKTTTPEELRALTKTEFAIVGPLVKSLGMVPN